MMTEATEKVFIKPISQEEMDNISKHHTAQEMLKLGMHISEKINQSNINNENRNKMQGLKHLEEQMQLSSLLNEYFELDEIQQKARMLEILSELTKLQTKNKELSKSLDELNKKYQEEKDKAEEYDQQCEQYIEELQHQDVNFKQLRKQIGALNRELVVKEEQHKKDTQTISNNEIMSTFYQMVILILLVLSLYFCVF